MPALDLIETSTWSITHIGARDPPLVFAELVHLHLVLLALAHFLSHFPLVLPIDERVCVIYLIPGTILMEEYQRTCMLFDKWPWNSVHYLGH